MQKINMSVTLDKINVYLPTDYIIKSDMLVVQIKNLKILKREHESNLLAEISEMKDEEDEFFDVNENPD